MSTTLANAVNGAAAPKVNDHPTIVRIQAKADEFAKAMPSVMTKDRFMRIAIGAIRKNPKLLECDPLSLMGSLLVAAQLGFEVNTPLQHFFLIPRWNKNTGRMEADGQIGYKGWFDLVARSGRFVSMTAEPVHENDHFVYRLGDDPLIEHGPVMKDRGRAYAYYVSLRVKDGGIFRKVLTRDDVEKYRRRSQSPNSPAWVNDFDAMALKTTFLRIVPWLPKSTEMQNAIAYENTVEANGRVVYREKQNALDYEIPDYQLPEPGAADQEPDENAQDDEPYDAEVVETAKRPEPKPEPKAPRKRQTTPKPRPGETMTVVSETVGPAITVPFDDAPANDTRVRQRTEPSKPAPSAASQLAAIVSEIEVWFDQTCQENDEAGMPGLADREELMGLIWEKLAGNGQVKPETKHWYSRLNEIAKLAGDAAGSIRILDAGLEAVRTDYMGEPGDSEAPEPEPAKAEAAKPSAIGDKVAQLDKLFDEWAVAFDEANVSSYAMPQNVVDQVYFRAMKTGLVSANARDYRAKTKDLATIAETFDGVHAEIHPILEAMWGDFVKPEPGSDG